jgi:sec-independent protein translocase protein TatA
MGEFSFVHWLVVLLVAMLIFGPKRLPEIARALGESIKEFKKSVKETSSQEITREAEPPEKH